MGRIIFHGSLLVRLWWRFPGISTSCRSTRNGLKVLANGYTVQPSEDLFPPSLKHDRLTTERLTSCNYGSRLTDSLVSRSSCTWTPRPRSTTRPALPKDTTRWRTRPTPNWASPLRDWRIWKSTGEADRLLHFFSDWPYPYFYKISRLNSKRTTISCLKKCLVFWTQGLFQSDRFYLSSNSGNEYFWLVMADTIFYLSFLEMDLNS